jgi:hypothetical protein
LTYWGPVSERPQPPANAAYKYFHLTSTPETLSPPRTCKPDFSQRIHTHKLPSPTRNQSYQRALSQANRLRFLSHSIGIMDSSNKRSSSNNNDDTATADNASPTTTYPRDYDALSAENKAKWMQLYDNFTIIAVDNCPAQQCLSLCSCAIGLGSLTNTTPPAPRLTRSSATGISIFSFQILAPTAMTVRRRAITLSKPRTTRLRSTLRAPSYRMNRTRRCSGLVASCKI